MIHPYNDDNLRRWNRGEFKVQLDLPGKTRPMGYCDGSAEDEAEIVTMSEGEGEYALEIQKRYLKTGREIWTLKTSSNQADAVVDDDD